jgi:hypothetical protein
MSDIPPSIFIKWGKFEAGAYGVLAVLTVLLIGLLGLGGRLLGLL